LFLFRFFIPARSNVLYQRAGFAGTGSFLVEPPAVGPYITGGQFFAVQLFIDGIHDALNHAAGIAGPLLAAAFQAFVDKPEFVFGGFAVVGRGHKLFVYFQRFFQYVDRIIGFYNAQQAGAGIQGCAGAQKIAFHISRFTG